MSEIFHQMMLYTCQSGSVFALETVCILNDPFPAQSGLEISLKLTDFSILCSTLTINRFISSAFCEMFIKKTLSFPSQCACVKFTEITNWSLPAPSMHQCTRILPFSFNLVLLFRGDISQFIYTAYTYAVSSIMVNYPSIFDGVCGLVILHKNNAFSNTSLVSKNNNND